MGVEEIMTTFLGGGVDEKLTFTRQRAATREQWRPRTASGVQCRAMAGGQRRQRRRKEQERQQKGVCGLLVLINYLCADSQITRVLNDVW